MIGKISLLGDTFAQLADSLVDEFDVIELLTLLSKRCVELFDAGAAAVLLGDRRGSLQVVAASTEQSRLFELFQLQDSEGPSLECFASGIPIGSIDALQAGNRWPVFGTEMLAAGFGSVQAVPLRLRDDIIGTLTLFTPHPVVLPNDDLQLCQALADVATIAILQNQTSQRHEVLNGRLQQALDSRIAVEQAKGILSERLDLNMSEAFSRLWDFAGDHHRPLSQVASGIVAGWLSPRRRRVIGELRS